MDFLLALIDDSPLRPDPSLDAAEAEAIEDADADAAFFSPSRVFGEHARTLKRKLSNVSEIIDLDSKDM